MSKNADRELGMERSISRRDVLHGFGALAASSFAPSASFADEVLAAENAHKLYYPPTRTGMRGNHDGSFEIAHQLGREGKRDWGPVTEPDGGVYDLVVVGAGLSGLAAAHFFLKENPRGRVLILDNHDDFGGHAKRNEFQLGDRTVLGYGGSQSMVEPSSYPEFTKTLLQDLDIDIDILGKAYDQGFYKRHGLAASTHFNSANWGVDRVVRYGIGGANYLPLANSDLSASAAVAQMPISKTAKREMLRLLEDRVTPEENSFEGQANSIYDISYRDFIHQYFNISEPEVFAILQDLTLDHGAGIETVSAAAAMNYSGLPGANAAGMSIDEWEEPYVHHFPDGNASIARMLVRRMIPDVADGNNFIDIVGAQFDYNKLDVATSPVRLRLNSTVIRAQHDGNPKSAKQVCIDYVRDGAAQRIRAKRCVLACYNSIIPTLCPELPAAQKEALSAPVKSPILYTSVLLNNWRAWKELGIGAAVSSGSYHPVVMLDFPVSFGGQEFANHTDEPIVVHMERFPHRNNEGVPARMQRKLGRHELLSTSFETMERNIRQQLSSLLAGGDFDAARDIAGITVNRWAHGYTDGFWDIGDPSYSGRNDERRPNMRGRKPFGRITIANSDAGGSAMLESAVQQAHRAVEELI